MARISQLRKMIRNDFLRNDIISGNEAKALVAEVATGGLSSHGKQQLETLRGEFQAKFSNAGLREFDKAFAKAQGGPAPSGQPAHTIRGLDMSQLPTSFKLREIRDPDIKKVLRQMDLNNDGKVDSKDQKKLGLSDQQWQGFIFAALISGKKIDEGDVFPQDLTGKKICFTAVPDKAAGKAFAEAMGATVVKELDFSVDFLVVGNELMTGKDERAHAFNTVGQAHIAVGRWAKFLATAERAGAIPESDDQVDAESYATKIEATMRQWHDGYVRESYDAEFVDSTPAERRRLTEEMNEDLADFHMDAPSESDADYIEEMYEYDGPYLDAAGLPIPFDKLDIISLEMYPNFAGIGLSKTFVFDMRSGNLVDDFPVQD